MDRLVALFLCSRSPRDYFHGWRMTVMASIAIAVVVVAVVDVSMGATGGLPTDGLAPFPKQLRRQQHDEQRRSNVGKQKRRIKVLVLVQVLD